MTYKFESQEILNIIDQVRSTGMCDTDKGSLHTYTGMYEDILSQYKDKECVLLEIGIQTGGSALLWSKYLPNAVFSFSDINPVNAGVLDMIEKDRTFTATFWCDTPYCL